MILKKITIDEFEELKKIYSESFRETQKNTKCKIENIYGLYNGTNPVGLCTIDFIDNAFINKKGAYINIVCIKKDERGKGLSVELMKQAESICRNNNVDEIMLTSSSKRIEANHLYQKLNYNLYDTNMYRKYLTNK